MDRQCGLHSERLPSIGLRKPERLAQRRHAGAHTTAGGIAASLGSTTYTRRTVRAVHDPVAQANCIRRALGDALLRTQQWAWTQSRERRPMPRLTAIWRRRNASSATRRCANKSACEGPATTPGSGTTPGTGTSREHSNLKAPAPRRHETKTKSPPPAYAEVSGALAFRSLHSPPLVRRHHLPETISLRSTARKIRRHEAERPLSTCCARSTTDRRKIRLRRARCGAYSVLLDGKRVSYTPVSRRTAKRSLTIEASRPAKRIPFKMRSSPKMHSGAAAAPPA